MVKPPRRWLETPSEVPPGARELLGAAGVPDPRTRDRRWAALVAAAPAAPAVPAAPEPSPVAGGVGIGVKKIGAMLLLVTAAHRDQRPAPPSLQPAPIVVAPVTAALRSSPRGAPASPFAAVVEAAPAPVVPPAPLAARARALGPSRSARVAPPAEVHADPPIAQATVVVDDGGLDAERELLRSAYGALDADAPRALALAAEHARRFPSGLLGHEREVVTVEALHRIGRDGEALAQAEAFLRAWPTSTQAPRVRALRDRAASSIR